jgi:hypothetical protein
MWILASGDEQVHTRWQVLEHKGEGIVNRSGINDVVVIENEKEIVLDGVNLVEQGRQNRFGWWWLRGLEHTQHPFSNVWDDRLQSSDEVSHKASGVVIPFVQRKPGGRSLAPGYPFAQQRGLTEASRGRDEAHFAVQRPLVEALDQAGAEDNLRLRWGGYRV